MMFFSNNGWRQTFYSLYIRKTFASVKHCFDVPKSFAARTKFFARCGNTFRVGSIVKTREEFHCVIAITNNFLNFSFKINFILRNPIRLLLQPGKIRIKTQLLLGIVTVFLLNALSASKNVSLLLSVLQHRPLLF